MNRKLFQILFILLGAFALLFCLDVKTLGWGFWAHKEINRQAINSLPSPLYEFFSANADYISENAIAADQRRYKDKEEEFYHYIDIDRYGKYPFPDLPWDQRAAENKYGADSVKKNGLVPWRIVEITEKLSDAMRAGVKEEILFYAADLGHYIGDAHVPLHTTENYNGQLSDQTGIHSRFESRLPEMYGKDYDLKGNTPRHIENSLERAFEIVLRSYSFVDSLLNADLRAKEGLKEGDLYTLVKKNGKTEYQYSEKYYRRFHRHLGGLVQLQMREAVSTLGDFWFTAWVNAGKPNLPQ